MNSRRGVTLLEIMLVVAIIGVLTAIGGTALASVAAVSRVNGASKTLVQAFASARIRAQSTACSHFVQVNGSTWAGGGPPGFPSRAFQMAIVRKAACASTTFSFEAGDVIIDSEQLPIDKVANELNVPGLFAPALADNKAFTVGYDRNGQRGIAFDSTGTGAFVAETTLVGAALDLNITNPAHGFSSRMTIPGSPPTSLVPSGTPRITP